MCVKTRVPAFLQIVHQWQWAHSNQEQIYLHEEENDMSADSCSSLYESLCAFNQKTDKFIQVYKLCTLSMILARISHQMLQVIQETNYIENPYTA